MDSPHLLWLTQRGERHQQAALRAAPPQLQVTVRRDLTPDELRRLLAETDILISERSGVISAELLDQAPRLRLIVRLGALDHDIDLAACHKKGIWVSRQPVIGSMRGAEHVLMVILALLKRLNETQAAAGRADHGLPPSQSDENTFHYNWDRIAGIGGLHDQRVAILGMGDIGVELARRLTPFLPAQILYHKRQPYPPSVEQELGISYAPFEDCCRQADVLVALLPYSPQTRLVLNGVVFRQMKRGAILVHAGSGGTIHEGELIEAIHNGQIGGAGLDTFSKEPLQPDHPLIQLSRDPAKNIILTPHVAGGTVAADFRKEDYAEVLRFLAGEPLRYRVV
jgi:phosphoglycerate dehydrogenase-like enzyme